MNTSSFRHFYLLPLWVQNGVSHTYCINMSGKIYKNTKGYDRRWRTKKPLPGAWIHHNLETFTCNRSKYKTGYPILIVSIWIGKSIRIQRATKGGSTKKPLPEAWIHNNLETFTCEAVTPLKYKTWYPIRIVSIWMGKSTRIQRVAKGGSTKKRLP